MFDSLKAKRMIYRRRGKIKGSFNFERRIIKTVCNFLSEKIMMLQRSLLGLILKRDASVFAIYSHNIRTSCSGRESERTSSSREKKKSRTSKSWNPWRILTWKKFRREHRFNSQNFSQKEKQFELQRWRLRDLHAILLHEARVNL